MMVVLHIHAKIFDILQFMLLLVFFVVGAASNGLNINIDFSVKLTLTLMNNILHSHKNLLELLHNYKMRQQNIYKHIFHNVNFNS